MEREPRRLAMTMFPSWGLAGLRLDGEPDGLAANFTDLSMVVRDRTTNANNFVGDPNSKFTYSSPSAKYILGPDGLYTSASTLRTEYNTSGMALGVRIEDARTNVVLHNRDLTNAAWVKTDCTAAKTQVGIDGVANSASSLTAMGANATCLQAITLASSARFQSAFVKRLTGTGTIEMTLDNGATWTAIVPTAAWSPLTVPTQTLANPTVGFRLATSGDAIAVDFVQNENSTFRTSPIVTTAASVTRAGDLVKLALTLFPFNGDTGSYIFEGYPLATFSSSVASTAIMGVGAYAGTDTINWFQEGGGSANFGLYITPDSFPDIQLGLSVSMTANTLWKAALAHNLTGASTVVYRNGTSAATNTNTYGTIGIAAQSLTVGARDQNGSVFANCVIKSFTYLPRRMTNAELQAITT